MAATYFNARIAGRESYKNNKGLESNPHIQGTNLWWAWYNGFYDEMYKVD